MRKAWESSQLHKPKWRTILSALPSSPSLLDFAPLSFKHELKPWQFRHAIRSCGVVVCGIAGRQRLCHCRSHIWTWSVALPPWKMSWSYNWVLPPWSFMPLAPFVVTCAPVCSLKQLQDMHQAHPGLLLPLWVWWTGSVILDHIAACSKAACIPQLFHHVFA